MLDQLALSSRVFPTLALVLLIAVPGVAAPREQLPSVDGVLVGPRPKPSPPKKARKADTKPAEKSSGTATETPVSKVLMDPTVATTQARALRDAGKPAEAEAILRPYLATSPVDADVRVELAQSLSDQSKDAEAVSQWEEVLRARPEDDNARLRLADIYLGLDQADSALEQYQAVLGRNPNDPALRRRTGMLLVDLDRGAEAVAHLEAYSVLVPGDDEVMNVLEKLYRWNDRPDLAIRILERRIDLHPGDIDAVRQLAESCVDLGNEKKAIDLYQKVVMARPDDLEARHALGELYEWNGAPTRALEQYDAYLKARPFDSEVRARSLSLSSDLGLGSEARMHGYFLRSTDPRFQSRAREAILADTGFGSWAGVEYDFYNELNNLTRHLAGPRAQYRLNNIVTLGLWYQFRHLSGPSIVDGNPKSTVMGHAVGVFSNLSLPLEFKLSLGASFAHYDTGFNSGNGFLNLSRDFGPVNLSLQAERTDLLSSVGDVQTKVVSNDMTLGIDTEPVDRFLMHFSGTWGYYSDKNQRLAAGAGVGWRPLDSPRIELWYEYMYNHFKDPETSNPDISYFAPLNYQRHGPMATMMHAVTTWFAYGLDLHLWHVYDSGEQSIRIESGAKVTLRPALHHLIQLSYLRTDAVWSSSSAKYRDQQGTFTYAYEF
jgi:predicted Zn-dependent protease